MMSSKFGILYSRVCRARRVWGLRGTVYRGLRHIVTHRARRRWVERDRAFDREHGVETAGIVPLQALDIESSNKDLGVRYQASNPDRFRALMASLASTVDGWTFVDLGAGKGRAMLLASELPFRRVVGVEFAPALCDVARQNVQGFSSPTQRCRNFEVICADAVAYELPDEPTLVYVYNSFEEPVMRAVLANVRRSMDERPRQLLLAMVKRQLDAAAMVEIGWRCLVSGEYGEVYEPASLVGSPPNSRAEAVGGSAA